MRKIFLKEVVMIRSKYGVIVATIMAVLCMGLMESHVYAEDVIKIGSISSTSGPAAHLGRLRLQGGDIAVEEVNAKGGIMIGGKPHKVQMVQYDDKCSAKDAVTVAERLINSDKVPVIIGATCSHATLAAMELTEQNKIPMVNAISASMKLTSMGYKYIFRTGAQTALQTEAITKFAVEDLKLKTAALIGRNDAWAKSGFEQFKKRMEARGGKVVAAEHYELGSTDFYSILMKVKMANPDFIWTISLVEDGAMVVKQARELGIKAVMMGTDEMGSEAMWKLAGAAAPGVYVYWGGDPPKPAAAAYEKKFLQKYGVKSINIDKIGYDTTYLVMDAIKRAGSTDPEKITNALRNTRYEGIRTTYAFAESGQAKVKMWIVQLLEDTKYKYVKDMQVDKNPPLPIDRE
jgi:branched-chain amino acid transport system substrate-binding protein